VEESVVYEANTCATATEPVLTSYGGSISLLGRHYFLKTKVVNRETV